MNKPMREFSVVEELKPYSRSVKIKVKVASKNEARQVISRTTGELLRVAEALVGDETGSVLLTLWNDDIEKVDVDKIYEIDNGYCKSFKGSLRLNVGRQGKIKTIEDAEFGKINMENNLSERVYEQQFRIRRRPFRRGGYRRSQERRR